ncbi:MAG: hypothetical protein PHS04_07670 [Tissierellia bacterium]|jgi:hypothetical protein|nr:hypothetical protein [Tissierellia bacterium]
MNPIENFKLEDETRYIYTFFIWTASNCAPNRDGGTGEIRVDSKRRVFTTQECFNQNIKNGIFFASQSGEIADSGTELLGCKNTYFQPTTLKKAKENLLKRISSKLNKKIEGITSQDIFNNCFDIPVFGLVNSEDKKDNKHPAFDFQSITGSAGLIYLPKTITQISIENRGISNAFVSDEKKAMSGSHYTDYLEEGVFSCLGFFNVTQLEIIAGKIFKLTDKETIRHRIEELYRLYLTGIWEGFKLLGYASVLRKGQQPYALYCAQKKELPDYISDPADLLMKDSVLPGHTSFERTLADFECAYSPWMGKISKDWQIIKKMEI